VLAISVRVRHDGLMEPRFRSVDRDQQFLLPPDVREWLPSGHPALFVVELVEVLDLSAFRAGYRSTRDRGRPAYHPEVMVGIALYASMTSTMSSRRIERLLATDAGFRVVAANERPDHVTICRFLVRHRDALAGLFDQVVGLAAEAGLVDPTLVAVDGTKMAANASKARNDTIGDLRRRYAEWSDTVADNDRAEAEAEADAEASGKSSGPVAEMADRASMREWISQRLAEREDDPDDARINVTDPDSGLLPRSGGGWVQGYNAQAAAVAGGIVVAADVVGYPNDSVALVPMMDRIEAGVEAATGEMVGVVVADAGYWNTARIDEIEADPDRADVLIATGRTNPTEPPDALPEPDLVSHQADLDRYDEAVAAEQARRIPVIDRVVNEGLRHDQAAAELGISIPHVSTLKRAWERGGGPEGLPPPKPNGRHRPKEPKRPTPAARARHDMDTRLASPAGKSFYRQRQAIIEPVFGDLKTNRRINRLWRRGINNARAEWFWILTGHNLTILHQNTT
jgi:transposase